MMVDDDNEDLFRSSLACTTPSTGVFYILKILAVCPELRVIFSVSEEEFGTG